MLICMILHLKYIYKIYHFFAPMIICMIIHLKYIHKIINENNFKGEHMIIFTQKKVFIYANQVSRSICSERQPPCGCWSVHLGSLLQGTCLPPRGSWLLVHFALSGLMWDYLSWRWYPLEGPRAIILDLGTQGTRYCPQDRVYPTSFIQFYPITINYVYW